MQSHPAFKIPDDNNVSKWRYTDLMKLAAMLEKGGLFFARADLLGDPFEGSYPQANEPLRARLGIPDHARKGLADVYRRMPKWTMISCWHKNELESAAMWRLYGDGRAFALRSTYARLRQALDYEDVFIGEVEYIDYERQWMPEGNSFYPFMHKRKSFEHENELRAVIQLFPSGDNGGLDWDKPPTEFGVWRDVQLGEMISEVLVFPGAPGWIPGVLRDLLSRYGLNIPVRQSSLDKEPFY